VAPLSGVEGGENRFGHGLERETEQPEKTHTVNDIVGNAKGKVKNCFFTLAKDPNGEKPQHLTGHKRY